MVSQKSPRKNVVSPTHATINSPASLKKIGGKTVVQSSRKYPVSSTVPSLQSQSNGTKMAPRPRRFSLLYSSEESSLSDVDTTEQINDPKIDLTTQSRKNLKITNKNINNKLIKSKAMSNNSNGKKSKLIQRSKNLINNLKNSNNTKKHESDTDSSDYAVMDSSSDAIESSDDDDDDDDDDESDSGSDTSSDDENIDFVKLTAQRKKRAMKALNAMKRGKTPAKSNGTKTNDDNEKQKSIIKSPQNVSGKNIPGATHFKSNNMTAYHSSEEEEEEEGLDNKHEEDEEEDIGEEVPEDNKASSAINIKSTKQNKDSNELTLINNQVGEMHVPQFTESEESDYDIDQDAYFNVLMDNNDDTAGEIDTGLETAEDELPILHEEEQQIVADLQNDDSLSFDGSIHEDGMDPVDLEKSILSPNENNQNINQNPHSNDLDEEDEDEIMSDFDLPFYEDPKFSSLYYYADNTEPKLSLSTDLPLILNERKESKLQRREAKKRELKERLKSRKLLREKVKKTANVAGDEYIFGVFFHSDNEDDNGNNNPTGKVENLDGESQNIDGTITKRLNLDKSLKRLSTSALIDSSDDEYDNILMDIAHIPTDDEDEMNDESKMNNDNHSNTKHHDGTDSSDMSSDEISDEEDDSSVTNIFIDIDDLDPDSFYFHYDDVSSSDGDDNHNDGQDRDDATETVVYADDESTDEDDNLPPPSARSKINYTKPKEIVSANVVGLKPPKLGTWETDNKPFSIIDGLSTKSLYSLIQEHQQLHDQNQRGQTPEYNTNEENISAGEELTLNELLNMSELEDEEGDNNNSYQSSLIAEWYNKPKIPLSAFRNKGVSNNDDSEFMIPNFSTKKVPIGYLGVEKTRRKIDKMKELQKKRNEKKRKLKKKRKVLKLRRERARMEKEKALLGDVSHSETKTPEILTNTSDPTPTAIDDFNIVDTPDITLSDSNLDSRKNSIKSVGIDEIHQILTKDDSNLLDNHNVILDYPDVIDGDDNAIIDGADADILASLTAPVDFEDFNNKTLWKQRRQSMVEAAAENMRFTKSGLFSESALADIEGIIGTNGNGSGVFEFNEVLQ